MFPIGNVPLDIQWRDSSDVLARAGNRAPVRVSDVPLTAPLSAEHACDRAIARGTSDGPVFVYSILPTWQRREGARDVMHHKRKGPKSTRSGCLLCKPHKRQGVPRAVKVKGQTGRHSLRRAADFCACSRGEAR